MRKASFIFIVLTLGLFAFQNVSSEEESRIRNYGDPSSRRYVLWRVYIQPTDSNGTMYVSVDSVLKEDFQTKEKFKLSSKREDVKNLKSNAYYLMLGTAGCSENEATYGRCFLLIKEDDYVLPDTPENKKFLYKKWKETKVTYIPPSSRNGGVGSVVREKSSSGK